MFYNRFYLTFIMYALPLNLFLIYSGIKSGNENKCKVKSLKEYREGKAKEWKKRTAKDQGSEKKKKDSDVVVNIGLMEWNDKEQELRRKRGKRLPLRVSLSIAYQPLLQESEKKWQNFHSNLYDSTQIYSLLYDRQIKKLRQCNSPNDGCLTEDPLHLN